MKTLFILNTLKACLHRIPTNVQVNDHVYILGKNNLKHVTVPVDSNFL
jgi:hypothetical protein